MLVNPSLFLISYIRQNLRYIAEYISKLENGQYVLVKSAFKSSIKILRMDESEEEKSEEEYQE